MKRQNLLRTAAFSLLPIPLLIGLLGFSPLVVFGSSMEPTLAPGQVALLDRHYYRTTPLHHGDIVAFRWNGETYVKRVYALAGETVTLLDYDGSFWPVTEETTVQPRRNNWLRTFVRVRSEVVPPEHFYCLGDNANASLDSRDLGPIPVSAILGRVESLSGQLLLPETR